MDGTTSYSRLSDAALKDAKARVDPALNPIDHENVRGEIDRRKSKRRRRFLPIMQKVVGGFLLGGGVVLVGALGGSVNAGSISTTMLLILAIFAIAAAMTLGAGVLLLAKRRSGLYLGIMVLALQLVSFSIGGVRYQFVPLYAVQVGWVGENVSVHVFTGPDAIFQYGREGAQGVAVDLVAFYGLAILCRAVRMRRPVALLKKH